MHLWPFTVAPLISSSWRVMVSPIHNGFLKTNISHDVGHYQLLPIVRIHIFNFLKNGQFIIDFFWLPKLLEFYSVDVRMKYYRSLDLKLSQVLSGLNHRQSKQFHKTRRWCLPTNPGSKTLSTCHYQSLWFSGFYERAPWQTVNRQQHHHDVLLHYQQNTCTWEFIWYWCCIFHIHLYVRHTHFLSDFQYKYVWLTNTDLLKGLTCAMIK